MFVTEHIDLVSGCHLSRLFTEEKFGLLTKKNFRICY